MGIDNIDRNLIIKAIENILKDDSKVYALWLEGADGLDNVDEYSDLDFVVDVEDGYEEEVFNIVENELIALGHIDVNHRSKHGHPKMRQKVYHLENSSEYLLIDFCIQSHSRDRSEGVFVKGDIVEAPKVIFDKDKVVRFGEDSKLNKEELQGIIYELQGLYKQHSMVIKLLKDNKWVMIKLDKDQYTVQGDKPVSLGMEAKIKDSTGYVPLSFFEKIINLDVKFGNGYIFMASKEKQNKIEELNLQGKVEDIMKSEKSNKILVKSFDQSKQIILNINEDTKIIDPMTDKVLKIEDIKKGDEINAYYSPMMTKSLPPISNAYKIEIINEVGVSEGKISNIDLERKSILVLTQKSETNEKQEIVKPQLEVLLHIGDDTNIVSSKGEKIDIKDLKEGMTIKAYHSKAMTMSLPPQTGAKKIIVFE